MTIEKPITIAIIPARAGSKGLKNKNTYPILNKPLIQWTLEQCKESRLLDDIFISTDDEQIINLSIPFGFKTINRPASLCNDDSTSESALIHSLEVIKEKYNITPEIIVFLQATSPLRKKDDIDNAINYFIEQKADSLFSATKISDLTIWQKSNTWESINFDYNNRKRRQDMPINYIENGSIYIFKPKILKQNNNRLGGKIVSYEMDFWQTWEIDSILEADLIEYYLNKYKLN